MRYESAEIIPPQLAGRIRALLRAEWPAGADEDDDDARPLIDSELHPTYFVLADGDQLLSYARTIWAPVAHVGQSFKLYGLGDVVTRPGFRQKGYGGRLVEEATTHIKSDREADAALLLTEQRLEAFYRRAGWRYVVGLRVATAEHGECAAAWTAFPMMLFLSAKAHTARRVFPTATLRLSGDEW
jgi:predicted GNAT family N-acyltransferase